MSKPNDILYKEKYLKYKSKYMELKKIEDQMGGFTLDDGIMCFFTSSELASTVKEMFDTKSPKLDQIKEALHNQAYVVEDGEKELELVLKPSSVFKKAEPLPDNKPKKVAIVGRIFNRCKSEDVNQVKNVLRPYNFIPKSMIVIRIYKNDKNQLMSVTPI